MTAAQLIARAQKGAAPAAALLLGPEAYERRRIQEALAALYPGDAMARRDFAEDVARDVVTGILEAF